MESFSYILPSPMLLPYVKHYWMLMMTPIEQHVERIIPTGHVSLIFHRQKQMISSKSNKLLPQSFISGHSSNFTDLLSTGDIDMIVVVFEPFGASAFFQIPISELNNQNISIQDLGIKSLIELEDQIQNTTSNILCMKLIEQYLLKQLRSLDETNYRRLRTTIEAINQDCSININQLSNIACLSYKQFNRIFTEKIGASPKEFSRIIRFQRALYTLQVNPTISLTLLAIECGYYDQSHLIREFKVFSGYTPNEYISQCIPYSDYFTPI